jgi:deoxyribonuclease-1
MQLMHGVEIPPDEQSMFVQWAAQDPVSPWETEREERIAAYSRVINPFVHGVTPDPDGACPWE